MAFEWMAVSAPGFWLMAAAQNSSMAVGTIGG